MPLWKPIALFIAVVLTQLLCWVSPGNKGDMQAGVVMKLPVFVEDYSGFEEDVSAAEKQILPADTEFAKRVYQTLDGYAINAQIVLSGGARQSIHRPEVCLPAQGWTISGSEVVPVMLNDGRELKCSMLTLTRDITLADGETITLRNLFLYWYVGHDVYTHSNMQRILMSSFDRLTRNVNHRWAYVIVSGTVTDNLRPDGLDYQETLTELKEFIAELAPAILTADAEAAVD